MPKNNTKTKKVEREMTLEDLLVTKLKALYDVENQLVKALPKLAKKADHEDLRRGFERHAKQTEGHVGRLERGFDILEIRPQKLQSDAIRGLIADADWVIKNVKGDAALDANLVAAAQYIEYYEIAGYESALAWAKLLDMVDLADLLQETLDEERETSDELMELAIAEVNERALGDEGMGEDEEDKGKEDEKEDKKDKKDVKNGKVEVEEDEEEEEESEEEDETPEL